MRIISGAIAALILIGASAATIAHADPNVETQLPADGVTSIERVGNIWTVTTEAVPSEVKVMSPFNSPICGVNYVDKLGLCTTQTSFTADANCVYVQVDGIPGHVHSDPYVCRTGPSTPPTTAPPTTEPPATEPPTTAPPTTTTPPTEEPPSTQPPVPTTTPTTEPPSSTPSPTPSVTTPATAPSFRVLDSSSATPTDQLAATGAHPTLIFGAALLLLIAGVVLFLGWLGWVKRPR